MSSPWWISYILLDFLQHNQAVLMEFLLSTEFRRFSDFYPYYLSEHQHKHTKLMHFIGTSMYLLSLLGFILTHWWPFLALCLLFGYGFAWLSHLLIEHNRPATFRYPLYSLLADHVMFVEILRGKHAIW